MDKPPGASSARAVSRIKRRLPKKTKIGHTGTLDPLASGLLVLLVGRATRLSRYVTGLDKTYTATATFGATSDTLDAEGEIYPLDHPMPTEDDIRRAAEDSTGDILQVPPMASAVKVGGERLYKLHRQGVTVERESRPVKVHELSLSGYDPENRSATFHVSCSGGTYVRTLISDLADALGTGAYLTALRRTSVGHLGLEGSFPETDLEAGDPVERLIPAREVVTHLPAVEVPAAARREVCNGRALDDCGQQGTFRVEAGGELLGIYREREGTARAEVVLCG